MARFCFFFLNLVLWATGVWVLVWAQTIGGPLLEARMNGQELAPAFGEGLHPVLVVFAAGVMFVVLLEPTRKRRNA